MAVGKGSLERLSEAAKDEKKNAQASVKISGTKETGGAPKKRGRRKKASVPEQEEAALQKADAGSKGSGITCVLPDYLL